jgi:hypothetical protein
MIKFGIMKILKTAWILIVILIVQFVFAEEGMWLLNNPPRQQLREKYGFELTEDWLKHAQLSAVRFSGASGSFVSPNGLIITNHHVGSDCLEKLNVPGKNYYRDGFAASGYEDEIKCPDLELNILQSIEDVTAKVNSAITPGMSTAESFAARQRILATIEKESLDQTGFKSDVVKLYQGGLYHLYRYKKYTDVRLVFAPEQAVAFFGGDTDNFEFPRFNLDICFFRVYESGKPVQPQHYLKWSKEGPAEGELVLLFGNPGSTSRHETLASLKFKRDVILPYNLKMLRFREALIRQFNEKGEEYEQMAGDKLHSYANSRKSLEGQYEALLTPSILEMKQKREKMLQDEMAGNSEMIQAYDSAVSRIEKSLADRKPYLVEYYLFERGDAFNTDLFTIARRLVRLAAESGKPGPERLREYRESNLESLRYQLFSPAPLPAPLQKALLAESLSFAAENLGADHPAMLIILDGRSPSVRAQELVAGSRLADPEQRKKIAAGGWKAIQDSEDPMIQLALKIDPTARELRKKYETEVEEVEQLAYGKIAATRFNTFGTNEAPDATSTLRMSFGVVKGYSDGESKIPYATTFAGAFSRAEMLKQRYPFALPQSWLNNRSKLDLSAPLNFVSTADTVGGSSGSPVLNRNGEFAGINFDRNRFGLARNFVYDETQGRHVAVHSAGILHALREIYKNERLVNELLDARK